MIPTILQNIVAAEETENLADSLKTHGGRLITELSNNPQGVLHDLMGKAVDFGLKVLGALVIYIVGAWLIRRIKKVLHKLFEKKKTEKTVASFVISLVTLILTVLLIVITVSTLGINTTSFAALLAAVGVALGMALSGTVQNFAGGIIILIFKAIRREEFHAFVTVIIFIKLFSAIRTLHKYHKSLNFPSSYIFKILSQWT